MKRFISIKIQSREETFSDWARTHTLMVVIIMIVIDCLVEQVTDKQTYFSTVSTYVRSFVQRACGLVHRKALEQLTVHKPLPDSESSKVQSSAAHASFVMVWDARDTSTDVQGSKNKGTLHKFGNILLGLMF